MFRFPEIDALSVAEKDWKHLPEVTVREHARTYSPALAASVRAGRSRSPPPAGSALAGVIAQPDASASGSQVKARVKQKASSQKGSAKSRSTVVKRKRAAPKAAASDYASASAADDPAAVPAAPARARRRPPTAAASAAASDADGDETMAPAVEESKAAAASRKRARPAAAEAAAEDDAEPEPVPKKPRLAAKKPSRIKLIVDEEADAEMAAEQAAAAAAVAAAENDAYEADMAAIFSKSRSEAQHLSRASRSSKTQQLAAGMLASFALLV